MFSKMNFPEDVYAKGIKDTLHTKADSALSVVDGWSQGRQLHVLRRTDDRIKEYRFYFPSASIGGDMYLVEESCIYLAYRAL